MLNKIAKKIAKVLVEKTENKQQMEEVYVYGLELIISTMTGFFSILFLSALLGKILLGVVFICFFAPLRMFVGGYHADTYGKCFIVSNLSYVILVILKEIIWNVIPPFVLITILFLVDIYIFFRAPIINEKQCISNEKRLRNRKAARIILIIQFVLILSLFKSYREVMTMAVLSVCLVMFFMLLTDKQTEIKIRGEV